MTPPSALAATALALASSLAACASAPAATAAETRAPDDPATWLRACDPADLDDTLADAIANGPAARDVGTLAGATPSTPIAEVTAGDRRYYVIPDAETGGCIAFDAPAPTCAVRGRFLGGDVLAAHALTSVHCAGDGCPLLLTLSTPAGSLAFAARLSDDLACNSGASLSPMGLFDDRAALVLTCRSSMGAAYHERLILTRVASGRLETLLDITAGVYEHLSLDEIEEGMCPNEPVGWIRQVPGADDVTLVQTFEPRDESASRGEGVVQMHRWSEEHDRFEPYQDPIVRTYDARRCR